jgi:transposase-like protein
VKLKAKLRLAGLHPKRQTTTVKTQVNSLPPPHGANGLSSIAARTLKFKISGAGSVFWYRWVNKQTCDLPPLTATSPRVVKVWYWSQRRRQLMPRKRFKTEEIIQKLRESEILLSQGKNVAEACHQIGVTDQTYYRWRKEYGRVPTDQAKRLKELDRENARLKKQLAEAELDKAILREAASGNF